MGYHIEFSDVTKYKGEAIVNSLGIEGNVYGRLCQNIVNAANSPKLTNFINSKLNNKVGDIFLTDAGELPCEKIIHIVTPFKHMDDDKNTELKKAYRKILDTALIQGYKSIAIPFIGTGANGYSDRASYDALTSACEYLLDYEEQVDKDVLEVTIVGYLKESSILSSGIIKEYEYNLKRPELYSPEKIRNYRMERVTCDEGIDLIGESPKSSKPMLDYNNIQKCIEAMTYIDEDQIYMSEKGYKKPYDFIKGLLKEKGKTDKIFKKFGITPNGKYKLSTRQSYQKKTIYKLAFMCEMNMSELVQFMLICETSFSPYSKLDLFMIDYYTSPMYKCRSAYDFAALVKKYTKEEIFINLD